MLTYQICAVLQSHSGHLYHHFDQCRCSHRYRTHPENVLCIHYRQSSLVVGKPADHLYARGRSILRCSVPLCCIWEWQSLHCRTVFDQDPVPEQLWESLLNHRTNMMWSYGKIEDRRYAHKMLIRSFFWGHFARWCINFDKLNLRYRICHLCHSFQGLW